MRRILRVLVFFAPALLLAQSTKVSPDCDIPFTLTASGQSSPTGGCAQNLQGVVTWEMTYQSDGFSGLSILVQQAPDSSGSPGTWSTFTAATGSNPNTSTTGVNAQSGYTGQSPWVRVTLSSATGSGTIVGHLYGWRTGSGGGSGGGGGGSGCAGTVATPCQIGTDVGGSLTPVPGDANGRQFVGVPPSSQTIALSSSGLTQIIPATSGKTISVFHLGIAFASAVNFQLEYGTGANCGTGTTALTGTYQSITAITYDPGDLPQVPSGNALCANLGSSVTGGGVTSYSNP